MRVEPTAGDRLLRFISRGILEFSYFQEVLHSGYHTGNLGRIFYGLRATDFTEAQGLNGTLLTLRAVNNAFHEFDLDLRHRCLTVKNLGQSDTTLLSNLHGVTHLQQSVEGCLNYVVGVRRTFRLSQYVLDAGAFKYGTHSTTSNYTSTSRSGLHEHETTGIFAFHHVGNSVLIERHFHQVLFSVVDTFSNSVGNFVGFAEAVTYGAVAVTYYYDGREAEATTTFYYFGNAVDSYYLFFQIGFAGAGSLLLTIATTVIATTPTVVAATVIATTTGVVVEFCHDDLEIEAAFAGSFCQ